MKNLGPLPQCHSGISSCGRPYSSTTPELFTHVGGLGPGWRYAKVRSTHSHTYTIHLHISIYFYRKMSKDVKQNHSTNPWELDLLNYTNLTDSKTKGKFLKLVPGFHFNLYQESIWFLVQICTTRRPWYKFCTRNGQYKFFKFLEGLAEQAWPSGTL